MTDETEKDNSPLLDAPPEEGHEKADEKENVGESAPDTDADDSEDHHVIALEGEANPLVTSPLS